ncbi:ankyrin repeat-containing domain protein [Talaromyces proteolyticus]|uniref:Ankyrin repeat-containing domain protein n=1 Tax=Talaromyces proteolyticus TaxID=1131652 RepID=A0AAD4Q3K0_9EURO|nr:ankyrin repeat-containing domain protein [Talaromyces proteolyticus]KAH8701858.1 ankyrin repeat-containing domain protein [Talaromyces proteolyticus]
MITSKVLATESVRSAGRSLLKACAQGSLSNVKTYAPQLYTTAGIDKRAVPPLNIAIATAAENGHSNILRYFFTDIPQCRQSTHGPWSPKIDIQECNLPEEWRSAVLPDLVVLRTITGAKPAAFQTLMDFGLSVNHPMDKIGSPLTVAIQRQDVEMVRFLLSKGADANDQYWIPNDTVLARAASLPSLEILTLLLEHGAKIQGSKALKSAAENGRIDAATMLLARGADINEVFRHDLWDDDAAKDTIGTALHVAVQHDQEDFVRFLLQRGVRTDLGDGEGITPRQFTQAQGKTEMLELFDRSKE